MNFSKVFCMRCLPRFFTIALLIVTALMIMTAPVKSAEQQKTLVLPLKISTLADVAALANDADTAIATTTEFYGYSFLPRKEAQTLLDYQTSWPPAHEILKTIPLLQQYDYIVIGSLTEIAGQVSLDLKLIDLLSSQSNQYYITRGGTLAELDILSKQGFREIAAYTSRESIIASITPAGNSKIDSGAILQRIQTQPGRGTSRCALLRPLRRIR